MKKAHLRFLKDLSYMRQESFAQICRQIKSSHYTRNRKMPLLTLLYSVLCRKGRSLYMELREFKDMFKMPSKITKSGYHQQRMKLNPLAFLELLRFHAKNIYTDKENVTDWKGYLLLAVDGSDINVPLTKENVQKYGNASHKGKEPKERPQAGVSSLYDVLNRIIIDMSINECKFDERKAAISHLKQSSSVIGNKKSILLADRGYPGANFLLDLMEMNQYFVVRLGPTHYKREIQSMTSEDEWIDIIFDKTRINPYKTKGDIATAERLEKKEKIRLRFVKVPLNTGEIEFILTNVPESIISQNEMKSIYHCRWGIETSYDELKNKLQLENFTGQKPIIIEQDIYATGYLYNLISDIINDVEDEIADSKKYKQRKYPMAVNRNLAIGILKEELIRLILEKDEKIQEALMARIMDEISENVEPVRDDRRYPRTKGQLASNYCNNRKRSF